MELFWLLAPPVDWVVLAAQSRSCSGNEAFRFVLWFGPTMNERQHYERQVPKLWLGTSLAPRT